MDTNPKINDLVGLINHETTFIRKSFGMYAGYSFLITGITAEKISFMARSSGRNSDVPEQFICSFINSLLNFLQDMIPVPVAEATYFRRNASKPEFVKIYPFFTGQVFDRKSNVLIIEENVKPLREKLRQSVRLYFPEKN